MYNRFIRTYHGHTGKLSLAHDEWLELNNKEFALYPLVRTLLEGMSRQGQFIRLTQKAKHIVETIYSPGTITECIVHCSGTGSKGNCTPEKILIGEVIGLFQSDQFDERNSSQDLEHEFVVSLHGKLQQSSFGRSWIGRQPLFNTFFLTKLTTFMAEFGWVCGQCRQRY